MKNGMSLKRLPNLPHKILVVINAPGNSEFTPPPEKRNLFLRQYKNTTIRNTRLPATEDMTAGIQLELAETNALRSRCKWRELGETSAGYLTRTITTCFIKKNITSLQHSDNYNNICYEPSELQTAVVSFYH